MQLEVNEIVIPERITFNYDELKAELMEKVQTYESLVYTDDQIKEAKADMANLRKLKEALNSERIRREREYMKPFNEFKEQVNEIIKIIDKPIALIDKQVKEYTERLKQEKSEQVYEMIRKSGITLLGIDEEMIFSPKWLNASTTLKMIQAEIDERAKKIDTEIAILDGLDEFSFEAKLKYKKTLSLSAAIEEANELKRVKALKEQHEKAQNEKEEIPVPQVDLEPVPLEEQKPEPAARWITFEARLTVQQAKELSAWCKAKGIQIRAKEN